MYIPEFPYSGKQVIVSSDRVHIYAKSDSAVIFGKRAVIISTPAQVHINSNDTVIVDSPIVELGHSAKSIGEPVILGRKFILQLVEFLNTVTECGIILSGVGESNIGDLVSKLVDVGEILASKSLQLKSYIEVDELLESKVLSKTTYTR
jgi:hypothetical protein